jgi:catechol 2,3-dioxygenase-like lactoylglutathione lyase family enzyme
VIRLPELARLRPLSRRRLGALLVVALSAAAGLYLSPSRAASARAAAPARTVGGLAITVRDVDRSVDFYSRALLFEKVSDVQTSGADVARLFGVSGPRVRVVTMRLGAERLELVEDRGRVSRQAPAEAPRDERAVARIALAVNDIEQASLWLQRQHVQGTPEASADARQNTTGVRALSFEDPDGHALEIVEYPAGQGDARWQRPTDRVFLGIDHAALVVGDTDESLRFYRDTLGLRVTARRESDAPEPSSAGTTGRSRITTLRGGGGPAIELFESPAPRDARPASQRGSRQTLVVTTDAKLPVAGAGWSSAENERGKIVSIADATLGFRRGVTALDPDGHRVQLRASR